MVAVKCWQHKEKDYDEHVEKNSVLSFWVWHVTDFFEEGSGCGEGNGSGFSPVIFCVSDECLGIPGHVTHGLCLTILFVSGDEIVGIPMIYDLSLATFFASGEILGIAGRVKCVSQVERLSSF